MQVSQIVRFLRWPASSNLEALAHEPRGGSDGVWGPFPSGADYCADFLGLGIWSDAPESGLFSSRWVKRHCRALDDRGHTQHASVRDCILDLGPRLSPVPFFDAHFYVKANSDVRFAGLNPYFHWTRYGVFEGRPFCAGIRPRAVGLPSDDEAACSRWLRGLVNVNLTLIAVSQQSMNPLRVGSWLDGDFS